MNRKQKEALKTGWGVLTVFALMVFPPIGLLMFLAFIPDIVRSWKQLGSESDVID